MGKKNKNGREPKFLTEEETDAVKKEIKRFKKRIKDNQRGRIVVHKVKNGKSYEVNVDAVPPEIKEIVDKVFDTAHKHGIHPVVRVDVKPASNGGAKPKYDYKDFDNSCKRSIITKINEARGFLEACEIRHKEQIYDLLCVALDLIEKQ